MAQSRLEKIGTIYTRITSLMKSGAMKSEDKPIWYVIYEAFPPKYEPSFDRQPPHDMPIRNIFYEEDVIRAKFHKDVKTLPIIDLNRTNSISPTQKFLDEYNTHLKDGFPSPTAYSRALESYKLEHKITPTEKPQHTTESVVSEHTDEKV